MKKILHNNQVIITALAIMIAIAGYLNFSNNNSKNIGMSGQFYEASEEVIANKVQDKDKSGKIASKDNNKNQEVAKGDDVEQANEAKDDVSNPGEAVMVNNNITLDYFYSVKLDREQTRAKNKEELIKVVENDSISENEREVAVNKIIELTSISEKENASEMMLEAKGFKNNVVSIVDGKADVVVDADSITSEEVAQVVDVVNRKTGIEISNIVVTPVNSQNNK